MYCKSLRGTRGGVAISIFSRNSEMCKPKENIPEQIIIRPKSSEDLARNIAAYSILCWEKTVKSFKTKNTNCYNLLIEDSPEGLEVDEILLTEILVNEGGCSRLENNDIDENCGKSDQVNWEVDGNSITDQQLILIKYDDSAKQIVVKG